MRAGTRSRAHKAVWKINFVQKKIFCFKFLEFTNVTFITFNLIFFFSSKYISGTRPIRELEYLPVAVDDCELNLND